MEFKSLNDLYNWFYNNKGDIIKFHFDLSNCMQLIMDDYQQGLIYCSYDKIKKKSWLCKMQLTFEKNGSKRLIEFQHSMSKLTKITNEFFVYLKECFERGSWSLDFFNKEYSWSCSSRCGTFSYLTLQENIYYGEYLYKIGSK